MNIEDAIRSMDRYTRDELHQLCQAYLKYHSADVLREISAILQNFGSDEDDVDEIQKVLRR